MNDTDPQSQVCIYHCDGFLLRPKPRHFLHGPCVRGDVRPWSSRLAYQFGGRDLGRIFLAQE